MWKPLVCAALILINLPAASASGPDDADFTQQREETKTLVGVWTVTTWTICGQAVDQDRMREMVVTIDADTMTLASKDDTSRYKYQINPKAKPQEIDRFADHDAKRKHVKRGIYKLDGDTLWICFVVGGEDRPAEFASRFRRELLVLKRQNP